MLVKMFSVRSSLEGVDAEGWCKRSRNTNLALVSDTTYRFDICRNDVLVNMMSRIWLVRSSREQDISRKHQSRELISETIKSGDESMTQLSDM